ncbi:HD-GYP domain-containing protein [Shouchella miscanthi]|uniref:HD-GYP domain-containing protein n=1 Tax=Shouchella miscanthi TaxID=2598861 RepID=UPI0016437613|nr:HD domain-containing phosphohydrolase [Shouchella miscanthi]
MVVGLETKYVRLKDVMPGSLLGKEIFSLDGQILLRKGVSLTAIHLKRLKQFGIDTLPLLVPLSQHNADETVCCAHTRLYMSNQQLLVEEKSLIWNNKLKEIFTLVLQQTEVQESLTMLNRMDEGLYQHSLTVAFLSTAIGMENGFNEQQLKRVVRAALLHDIGKVVSEKFNEENQVLGDDHTWRGYNYLQTQRNLDPLASIVALSHHESLDGSGYPRGIKANFLHEITQTIAVANVFDRLTNQRKKKPLMSFAKALEFMLAFAPKRYSSFSLSAFMMCVTFFPTGSQVRLSNGNYGVVVSQNKGLPHRPIVTMIPQEDSAGRSNQTVKKVDLAKDYTLFIY